MNNHLHYIWWLSDHLKCNNSAGILISLTVKKFLKDWRPAMCFSVFCLCLSALSTMIPTDDVNLRTTAHRFEVGRLTKQSYDDVLGENHDLHHNAPRRWSWTHVISCAYGCLDTEPLQVKAKGQQNKSLTNALLIFSFFKFWPRVMSPSANQLTLFALVYSSCRLTGHWHSSMSKATFTWDR